MRQCDYVSAESLQVNWTLYVRTGAWRVFCFLNSHKKSLCTVDKCQRQAAARHHYGLHGVTREFLLHSVERTHSARSENISKQ